MGFLFRISTMEGYCLKILAELLQYSLKTAYYEIDATGIRLNMTDMKQHMLFNVFMERDNFLSYEISGQKICFGVNQLHMYSMMKTIKKKDIVTLFIDTNSPNELGIRIEPRERTKISSSYIKIHTAYNIPANTFPSLVPCMSIAVPSSDYSKTCKEICRLSKTINVTSCNTGIKFATNTNNIYSKDVSFGNLEERCDIGGFVSEYLSNITKLSGMSPIIYFHQTLEGMLVSRANIGMLGKIVIAIKSEQQIAEMESEDEYILEI